MNTLHCTLQNGVDLYVNERQKMRHFHARSTEEIRRRRKEECQITIFYSERCVHQITLYREVLHSFDWKSAIEHGGV